MTQKKLTIKELNRFGDLLEMTSPLSMNVEMLDGFFSALICSPNFIPPNQYFTEVFGEDYSFESEEYAKETFDLMMRHWNIIASELQKSLTEEHLYFPVLFEHDDGIVYGNDWATGFMLGVELNPEGWDDLFHDENDGGAIIPIMMLFHENDSDPETRSPAIKPDKREDVLKLMVAGLARTYRFFEPYRGKQANTPIRKTSTKIGRNDPCPCGSKRKYKHCCAANMPTLH
jgi:uncharacterized protein